MEHIKLQLETQTRVSESLERERDRAYDDYQLAQAQLHTIIRQYQDLAGTCSEVARERDKAKAEVQLLREDLHRYIIYVHMHTVFCPRWLGVVVPTTTQGKFNVTSREKKAA